MKAHLEEVICPQRFGHHGGYPRISAVSTGGIFVGDKAPMEAVGDLDRDLGASQFGEILRIQNKKEAAFILK